MPELPDLAVFQQNLRKKILNKEIIEVGVNAEKSLINVTTVELRSTIVGQLFTDIKRRGKHLIFDLNDNSKLVLHLMLRGRLEYGNTIQDHLLSDCFWFQFEDKTELRVTDQKRWVKLEILKGGDLNTSKLLSKLGPEADKLGVEKFEKILKKSRLGRIKPLLMDQKKIAGIGNAYVDEILWKSKIHPNKTASLLSDAEIKTLNTNINKVLEWGIRKNAKELGENLNESRRKWMKVYRKKGKPCPECRAPIEQTRVIGRDTFFCPKCQKERK